MPAFDLASRGAWVWLGGSLLLAVLWTNLAWLFSPWIEPGKSPDHSRSLEERIVIQLTSWRFAPALFQGLRLLYYVAPPFAALFWGHSAVVGRLLGLQRLALPTSTSLVESDSINANWLDWSYDIGWAAALGLGSWALLLATGWARRRALPHPACTPVDGAATGWETLREAFYHEVHWAFYRNAPIIALGLYWGTWVGLALVALEALANPAWRKGLATLETAPTLLLRAALAVVSSLLFLRTQNLWLAVLLHWAVTSALRSLYPAPSAGTFEGAGAET